MRSGDCSTRWSRIAPSLALWTAIVTSPIRSSATGLAPPNILRQNVVTCPVQRVRAIAKLYQHANSRFTLGLSRGPSRQEPRRCRFLVPPVCPDDLTSFLGRSLIAQVPTTVPLRC